MKVPSGFRIDDPAFPLLQAQISYWGISSADGAATGLTVVCADLVNEPSYVGLQIKMLTGRAAGQVKTILISAAGTLTVDDAFRDNTGVATTITAGTLFVILSQSAGGGGPVPPTGPSQGLSFMGDVTTWVNATSFASTDLAGFGDFAFVGTYLIYVFRDAAGVAPQGEFRIVTSYAPATGTFTHEAFSANLAVGDKIAIIHISVLFPQIVARGTFTFSSATVPADAGRTEGANYWDGCDLMPLLGVAAFQPRKIMTFAAGVFYMNDPFTVAPGNVWYVILKNTFDPVVGVDSLANIASVHVLGNKASTAIYTKDNVSDVIRYLKGIMDATITAWGVADAGSGAGNVRDAARTEANDWWNGQTILMLTGAAAFQKRPIADFVAATDDIIPAPNFDAAVGVGDIYVILAYYNMIVPRTADDTANALISEVIGRKDDSATPDDMSALATSSLVREIKRVLLRMSSDAFTATIQGVARTELDTILYQLATYIAATGAAYSATVNPGGSAKSNIEQTLEDLGDILAGAGITTYPGAAAPGDGISIAEVLRQIYNDLVAVNSGFQEQPDTAVNVNAIVAAETDILNLAVAATRYMVRHLRLKCADPGANTVTVRLYELVNDVLTQVDSFDIVAASFATYLSLMDMFGLPHLAGDRLQVTVRASAGGPYAVTGQYSHATAT